MLLVYIISVEVILKVKLEIYKVNNADAKYNTADMKFFDGNA